MSASPPLVFPLTFSQLVNPRFRALCPISSDVYSLMPQEKQMSASPPLVFPLRLLYHMSSAVRLLTYAHISALPIIS